MSIFDRLYNNKSESTFKAKFYRDMPLFEDCSLSLNESLAYQTVSLLAVSYIPKNFFFFGKPQQSCSKWDVISVYVVHRASSAVTSSIS